MAKSAQNSAGKCAKCVSDAENRRPGSRWFLDSFNSSLPRKLGTREITVKVHRTQVMHKMQAGSLAELVRMAERLHLFSSDQ
ncbi:MAG TPA: LuxR C-terminal-related transcriptional regulator [Terriglobales bacterium]|nr:LuxR C-terminal-related transcriptional regulator [Terriglobales bacterium]